MSAVPVLTKPPVPFTLADLEAMPDDGYRYELLDGMLLVSASPGHQHQIALGNLYLLLRAACPDDLQVLLGPFDNVLSSDTLFVPDMVVAPKEQFTDKNLPGGALLVVEIASPSTRRIDRLLKRDRYQEAGCRSYWLVDPLAPSITVLELEDGTYVDRGTATGGESLQVLLPYPVTVVPADLLA
ncbi:MAG: Uma2 family endonuclease [Actinobacteria bacterium]|nr:Uma2 family endonuclease [Actinomycetota bacterium]